MLPHDIFAIKNGSFVIKDQAFGTDANLFANCWVRDIGGLRPARIGSDTAQKVEIARNDEIRWLTQEFEDNSGNNPFLTKFREWQNLGDVCLERKSTRVSIQLARYTGNGARYVRHADSNISSHAHEREAERDCRVLTMVYYLNPGWKPVDGGHLRIYSDAVSSEGYYDVEPLNDRLLIFPSHIEHEVLPYIGNSPRWAVTMWLYASPSKAQLKMPTSVSSTAQDWIFVSIASYRDQDVINTVNDLLQKAADPSRVSVGICWQGDDLPDFRRITNRTLVRWVLLTTEEAAGPLHARNIILDRLFAGERYILQIDAHSRFIENWDSRLIQELKFCTGPKPILTAYPPAFRRDAVSGQTTIDQTLLASPCPILCADRFDQHGFLRIIGRVPNSTSSLPQRCLFWAAGFSFSEAKAFFNGDRPEIPYLFFGEETVMMLYFFRHGWDFFTPGGTNIIFHLWTSRSQNPDTALVVSNENRARAVEEYKRLMFQEDSNSSMRHLRTRRDFEYVTGVNFSQETVDERAKLGGRLSWNDYKIAAPLPKKAMSLIEQYLT